MYNIYLEEINIFIERYKKNWRVFCLKKKRKNIIYLFCILKEIWNKIKLLYSKFLNVRSFFIFKNDWKNDKGKLIK